MYMFRGRVNFNYLPRRGEPEKIKKRGGSWKHGAGAGLLEREGGLVLFLFNFSKVYHLYI